MAAASILLARAEAILRLCKHAKHAFSKQIAKFPSGCAKGPSESYLCSWFRVRGRVHGVGLVDVPPYNSIRYTVTVPCSSLWLSADSDPIDSLWPLHIKAGDDAFVVTG